MAVRVLTHQMPLDASVRVALRPVLVRDTDENDSELSA